MNRVISCKLMTGGRYLLFPVASQRRAPVAVAGFVARGVFAELVDRHWTEERGRETSNWHDSTILTGMWCSTFLL